MHSAEKDAWQALARGQQAASRMAAAVRTPVPAQEAFARLVTLQRLAAGSAPSHSETANENLQFHLRWCALRERLLRE